jgi:hypothetical protein
MILGVQQLRVSVSNRLDESCVVIAPPLGCGSEFRHLRVVALLDGRCQRHAEHGQKWGVTCTISASTPPFARHVMKVLADRLRRMNVAAMR